MINIRRTHRARFRARGFQRLESRPIERLEWQLELKAGFGGGVEIAGRLDGAIALQIGTVALKAQGLRANPF
jgi:hypothetical protein